MTHRPPGPRGVFRNSHLLFLRRDPERFLALARRYGDVVYFRIGPREVFLVSDPGLCEQILRNYYSHFVKDWGPQRGTSAFRNGLLTSEGADHRLQRQKMSALFARGELDARRPMIAEMVEEWSARQNDGAEIDLFAEMSDLAVGIAARLLFGCRIDAARIIDASVPLRDGFSRFMFPYAHRLRRQQDRGRKIQELVDELRMRGRDDPSTAVGLLAPLVRGEAHPSIGGDDQLGTFLVLSQETIRSATTFTWTFLSANPEARETLVAEAREGQSARYAEAVLLESMRLCPPQWMIGRRAIEPYPLGDYVVPRGALVLISPYIVHRDPRHFGEVERFLPERWLRPAAELPARNTYFPFGAGPRRCIGDSVAMVVATTILSLISRRWMFDCRPARAAYDIGLTLQPLPVPARIRAVSAARASGAPQAAR